MATSLTISAIILSTIATVSSLTNFNLPKEKHTHLHFYLHDTLTGGSPTAIKVAPAPAGKAKNVFGEVSVIDDPLTESPNKSSKLLGRAQGVYVQTSQGQPALLMALNFAFIAGEFNGSSLALIGRNPYLENVSKFLEFYTVKLAAESQD
ncbi:hypothetical protein J5N97_022299 [Dioscorea zingiberensis]|uniref:Dirigent protein n=1 Tax=Dioscorea zingiberensis TaxID=325984 RepID=A0A9D5HAP3_9LILI|nr:hypothetical protein J5N97_022299 [Dioscorea zingiberensis]